MDEVLERSLREAPLLRLVTLAGHATAHRWGRIVSAEHGLSAAEVNALLMLAWGTGRDPVPGPPGRATHAELAHRLLVRPASLTAVVDSLVRAGLVQRERDPHDRRVVWLRLTGTGAVRAGEVGARVREAMESATSGLAAAKEKVIREFLVGLVLTYHEGERLDG